MYIPGDQDCDMSKTDSDANISTKEIESPNELYATD